MLRFQLDTTGNLMKDLIAFWPLDEPGGQRRDMLGYNPLTDNATVTSAKGIGGQGNSANFVAANSEYLSVSDNPVISTGDVDFTICVWVYLGSTADHRAVFTKWDSSQAASNEFLLRYSVDSGGRFHWQVRNNADSANVQVLSDSLGSPTTGRWYFVACWHDATNDEIAIQVDNGRYDKTAHSGGVFNSSRSLAIGATANALNQMEGRIQYVGFWKRVLSQQEKTDLYNYGRGNRLITY